MRELQKGPKPQILENNAEAWTQEYVQLKRRGEQNSTIEGRYRHHEIKTALVEETSEKCAYCEAKITSTQFGDVEHIRPKRYHPSLFVEWSNLTLACTKCNNAKSDTEGVVNPYQDQLGAHFKILGPMIASRTGSQSGSLTVRQLDLNRPPLLAKRAKCLSDIQDKIELHESMGEGPLQNAIETEIRNCISGESEFSAFAKEFIREMGLGHLIDEEA